MVVTHFPPKTLSSCSSVSGMTNTAGVCWMPAAAFTQSHGVEASSYPVLDLDSEPFPAVCIATSATRKALLYLKATEEWEDLMV